MEMFLSWDHYNNLTIYYKIHKTYSTVSTPTLNTEKVVCIIDLGTNRRQPELCVQGWRWQGWGGDCVLAQAGACGGQREMLGSLSELFLYLIVLDRIPPLTRSSLVRLDWLAQETLDLLLCWGYSRCELPCPAFMWMLET